MPNIKSAKKAMRKAKRRTRMNVKSEEAMKRVIKDLRKLCDEGKAKEAKVKLPQVMKLIDKAAKKNVIHKNTASRYKSRLSSLTSKSTVPTTVKTKAKGKAKKKKSK